MHRLAKPAFWATGTAGSNPALSAISSLLRHAVLLVTLIALLPACAIERRLEIEAPEPSSEIYLDGRFVGRGRAHVYLPAEGTRRIESVHGGRIDARTLARLEGPTTWEFPLDLLFEALLKMPNAWVERVRLDALPKPEGSEEGDARRLADSLRRLDKLIHEGARSTR